MLLCTSDNPIPINLEIELDRIGVIKLRNKPVTATPTPHTVKSWTPEHENDEPPF